MRGGEHYYCDDEKDGMRDCTGKAVKQPIDADDELFELYTPLKIYTLKDLKWDAQRAFH